MRIFLLICFFISFDVYSRANLETHDFSFEYGFAYHTLRGEQKENNSKGRLTSSQNPFYHAAYTYRLSENFGLKLFGGLQFVQFNEPKFGTLIEQTKLMNHFGLEVIKKTSPISKFGMFLLQQDQPVYFAETPTEFRVVRKSFVEGGVHYSLGQRRRVGLLWGTGVKAFTMFPTKGGNVTTEAGYGGEAYARLGWVGLLGALYQMKAFYHITSVPNADINFSHEILGYAFMVSYSF